jgi:hypothetical protein
MKVRVAALCVSIDGLEEGLEGFIELLTLDE